MTDSTLEHTVAQALLEDDRLAEQRIQVRANGGTVTLAGAVQNHRRKLVAQEIASSIAGSGRVHNEINVRPAPVLPDETIANHVREALGNHPNITKDVIGIDCKAGRVTMLGHVGSHQEKVLAEDVALSSQGTRSVNNMLTVDLAREIEDESLCQTIRAALNDLIELTDASIRVAVSGDLVTLSGCVPHAWQKDMADRTVRKFRAQIVRNEIEVC